MTQGTRGNTPSTTRTRLAHRRLCRRIRWTRGRFRLSVRTKGRSTHNKTSLRSTWARFRTCGHPLRQDTPHNTALTLQVRSPSKLSSTAAPPTLAWGRLPSPPRATTPREGQAWPAVRRCRSTAPFRHACRHTGWPRTPVLRPRSPPSMTESQTNP